MRASSWLLLWGVLWLTVQVAWGQGLEQEVTRYQELIEAQNAELSTIDEVIAETRRALAQELRARDALSEDVLRLRTERDAIAERIAALQREQRENQQEKNALQQELAQLQTRLQGLLVSLHKGRSTPYARLLTESESLFELRLHAHYLRTLTEQDIAILAEFEDTEQALAAVNARLAAQLRELEQEAQNLEDKAAELASSQAALARTIAALEADEAGRLASRAQAIAEQRRLDALLAQAQRNLAAEQARQRQARLEAERRAAAARQAAENARRARAAAQARAQQSQAEAEQAEAEQVIARITVPETAPQSGFQSPVHNASLSLEYGSEGPFVLLQSERPYDAVRSVMSGVVIAANLISANSGYVVMVQHSHDLVSAYGNMQEPLVTVNQQVAQGEVLGYVGGGTFNAGDILDFRIGVPQANGGMAWVDPSARLGLR